MICKGWHLLKWERCSLKCSLVRLMWGRTFIQRRLKALLHSVIVQCIAVPLVLIRVGIVGGWTPSSCLQTLIFEWKSALNFNPRMGKISNISTAGPPPRSFRSIPTLVVIVVHANQQVLDTVNWHYPISATAAEFAEQCDIPRSVSGNGSFQWRRNRINFRRWNGNFRWWDAGSTEFNHWLGLRRYRPTSACQQIATKMSDKECHG